MSNKTPKQIIEYAIANPHREDEVLSNCCGSGPSQLSDNLCGSCLEHSDFE